MPIAIGGKRLEVYGIQNWDIFISRLEARGEKYISEFPFWIKIWEASMVLADHLMRIGLEKEKAVLEIGAGMGITGLFLGSLGHKVTITDYEEEALELLQMNVEHNGLNNVSVAKLDWTNPELQGKFDIICGSELVYKEIYIEPIINLFRAYLQTQGTVYLAHELQHMRAKNFTIQVSKDFEIENVAKTLRKGDRPYRVMIQTLRPRS